VLRPEQLLQQPLPLVRFRTQEPRELALREQHDLEELFLAHPEQPLHGPPDVVDARQPVRRGPARRRAHPGQRRLRRLLRRPAAALLGPLVLGAAHQPQPVPAHGQLEPHLGDHGLLGVVAAQPLRLVPHPRYGPEQRERHRVQQRRLARAGVAVQQEQPVRAEPVEVDDLTRRVRPERRQLQAMQPHAVSDRSLRCGAIRRLPSSRARR
jgi:hypothetical protein